MVYAYLRVSTDRQDLDNQRHGILEFASSRKMLVDEWVEETVSGTKSYKERKLGELVQKLKADDVLLLSEISRLGRSLFDVMSVLGLLMQVNVKVYTCKERFELGDNINSKVLAFAFSLGAEIERQMISQRTREALARRKAEGMKLGRPKGSLAKSKLDDRKEMVQEFLDKGISKSSMCKLLGCHPGTLDSFIRTRRLHYTSRNCPTTP